MPQISPDDRADEIACAIENYKCGAYGEMRTKAILVLCGLNATEIEEFLAPHRSSAFENFKNFRRGPVR